jgi:hypothetical protein
VKFIDNITFPATKTFFPTYCFKEEPFTNGAFSLGKADIALIFQVAIFLFGATSSDGALHRVKIEERVGEILLNSKSLKSFKSLKLSYFTREQL